MPSSRMLRRVAVVRTDDSEEHSASIIRVTRIDELGTMLRLTHMAEHPRRWHSLTNRRFHYSLCDKRTYVSNYPSIV
jgi:hypothetical protein